MTRYRDNGIDVEILTPGEPLGPLDVVTLSDEVRAYMAALGRKGHAGKGFAGMDPARKREIQAAGVAARQARAFGPHVHHRKFTRYLDSDPTIFVREDLCRCGMVRTVEYSNGVRTRGKWLKTTGFDNRGKVND